MGEIKAPPIRVHLPRLEAQGCEQDAEWCEIETVDGERRRLRFHDYAEIYRIPGLYEHLFYEELRCTSPATVRALLEDVLEQRAVSPAALNVLDLGAGNGMVGEELSELGIGTIVGVDILPEAAEATERDRPGVYDAYHVVDLTEVSRESDAALQAAPYNCLTSVGALSFGDIPPRAFARAFNAVGDGGLVAFTLRDDFLRDGDASGFSRLIQRMLAREALRTLVEHRYCHRLSVAGEEIFYTAIIAEKQGPVPEGPLDL